jgi:hypothetical protein
MTGWLIFTGGAAAGYLVAVAQLQLAIRKGRRRR